MGKRVSELEGRELDYWVAIATSGQLPGEFAKANYPDGYPLSWIGYSNGLVYVADYGPFSPSTDWSYGGPLVQGWVAVLIQGDDFVSADVKQGERRDPSSGGLVPDYAVGHGQTVLEAACRAIVASVYGEEVPDE